MEEGSYHDPYTFKPFRFSDVRDDVEGESTKHQMVSTSSEYLAFGLGKHAWYTCLVPSCDCVGLNDSLHSPGRFFAANELKAMLCYVVMNYDVSLPAESAGIRPPNLHIGRSVVPNPTAQVIFKKRA